MRNRATWVVGGFVAVIVVAATVNAVASWSSGRGRRSTTSQASDVTGSLQVAPVSGEPPLCGPNQLELRMDGRPFPPGAAAHEDFVFPLRNRAASVRLAELEYQRAAAHPRRRPPGDEILA